ncbi:hypothetical protein [Shumkonia mesophila]|uniref:hypothetical protein n=1 Tax=Shumkonia mesophila TaxID=2838854 RepID=UPI0029350C16|nr:hypothetical protein [Shumkonia mesophila]
MKSKIIFCAVLLVLVAGCDDTLEDQEAALLEYFSDNKIGSFTDYGVFKTSIAGTNHVVSVHGFVDDASICNEIAGLFNRKERGAYHCRPLN